VVEDGFRVLSHPWSERDLPGGLEGTLAQFDLILDNRENPKRISGSKPMWRWHLLASDWQGSAAPAPFGAHYLTNPQWLWDLGRRTWPAPALACEMDVGLDVSEGTGWEPRKKVDTGGFRVLLRPNR